MPIEVDPTRVGNLNPQWPRDSEIVAEGAAHIRNLKQAVRGQNQSFIGEIKMWYGTVNNIPPGFVLCNGSNGTPDLRNRFVVGAGGQYSKGATGGSSEVTLSASQIPKHKHGLQNAGNHTHGGETSTAGNHNHSASTGAAGSHNHSVSVSAAGSHSHDTVVSTDGLHNHTGTTTSNGSHNHTGSANSAGSHAHDLFMGGASSGPRQRISVDTGNISSDYIGRNNSTEFSGTHSHSLSIDQAGSHNHGLNVNSNGNHKHTVEVLGAGSHTHNATTGNEPSHTHSVSVNSNGNHKHNISQDGDHTHLMEDFGNDQPHENRPPYHAVFFIMRVAI